MSIIYFSSLFVDSGRLFMTLFPTPSLLPKIWSAILSTVAGSVAKYIFYPAQENRGGGGGGGGLYLVKAYDTHKR